MNNIAVIDVETTGINPYRHDRIVEIGAVIVDAQGRSVREFATLVNPERDIGPTSIHGLTSEDILEAPRFHEAAGAFIEFLEGCVLLAGHNVRFDLSFLAAEFRRLGHAFPVESAACTMQLAGGGSLVACCMDYGVEFDGDVHSALHDARAAARLLSILLGDEPLLRQEFFSNPRMSLPVVEKIKTEGLSREESRRLQAEPPSYLMRLASRANGTSPLDVDDSTSLAYAAILDRVLEDRRIDERETETLLDVAGRWGLSREQVIQVHESYLRHLIAAALADGVVTDSERRDLILLTRLLGIEKRRLDELLENAAERMSEVLQLSRPDDSPPSSNNLSGKKVCFTGECRCLWEGGEVITRVLAKELATKRGLIVVESVTKKLDLLVVADPLTQSGKAKKARRYGIRILHEPVFWKMLRVEVE